MARELNQSITSILIANRGEIACRIIRTAKRMGIRTIAVYSDADAQALHVKQADHAVHIGASPATESYLSIDAVIHAAKSSGADAVHPGYGFLSETADFARACEAAGIIFIGPGADAINLMGDKAQAKRRMIAAGVPCIPGYQGEDQTDDNLLQQTKLIGFPVMVKAAAGGGGRGMRLVPTGEQFMDALHDARAEAKSAFGSDQLILERAIQQPRHVEIQIFADQFGHVIHLGERDCSVQRRHQKVIEEAPCPIITDKLRAEMGAVAVRAAKDINYFGAGTVEFLLDSSGDFFFLEMNTRLQVEHPVTELITGLDLVEMQIRVARGEPLGLSQEDIHFTGHAIEARLYAENPAEDFKPSTGRLNKFRLANGDGIRLDSGFKAGDEVSSFYDPMLAKVIGYGPTRDIARQRLVTALKDSVIFGVETNQSLLINILTQANFVTGNATTGFIQDHFGAGTLEDINFPADAIIIACLSRFKASLTKALATSLPLPSPLLNWSSATPIQTAFQFDELPVLVSPLDRKSFRIEFNSTSYDAKILSFNSEQIEVEISGRKLKAFWQSCGAADIAVAIEGQSYNFIDMNSVFATREAQRGAGDIIAPMHGTLAKLFVKAGDVVTAGTRLAILEAMKMQHEILADIDGTVTDVGANIGDQISANQLICSISEATS
ncbi:acetyl-CoA carboxylase biotin carboxylase subunit [Litorimonas sp. RW-G-Af-16]|uniref:acetyl-CoA carboxylase biotin carboxylase subunit n=1 Tax=Litorimonas sp. RW-G-Af-16 TaxID=3241168 RepID=UPI00390CDA79